MELVGIFSAEDSCFDEPYLQKTCVNSAHSQDGVRGGNRTRAGGFDSGCFFLVCETRRGETILVCGLDFNLLRRFVGGIQLV